MTFNRKITLITVKQCVGGAGREDVSLKDVWANVTEPGITSKFAAEAAGYKAERTVYMWRNEYSGQSIIKIGNDRYHVEATGAADSDLHIKIILAKEG